MSTILVSVVIPTRNEERYITRCLNAVFAQTFPVHQFEVIVVDGRSTDRTREIVHEMQLRHSNLRLLDNPGVIITRALNIGIRAACGDIIIRIDGHAVVAPDYVAQCVRALEATNADNVGGPRRIRGDGFLGQAIARAVSSPFAGPAKFHHASEPQEVDSVQHGAFRREALERVGLFDESILRNEDYELNYRLRRSGGRIYYTPDITCDYYCRESLFALIRQYWYYGRGKGVVLKRHPSSLQLRHMVAPAFVMGQACGLVLALIRRPLPLSVLLGIYGCAVAFFTGRATRDADLATRGIVAAAFVCIHTSWGAGVLSELLASRTVLSLIAARVQPLACKLATT